MSDRAIIYGNIIGDKDRRQISNSFKKNSADIQWLNSPQLFKPNEGFSLIIVDLEDPTFTSDDFIISLATAGDKIKVVGKANDLSLEDTIKVSKLGVSEIITPDQCLKKLHDFLNSLEKTTESATVESTKFSINALIGDSPQMTQIKATLKLLADVDFPSALILGDTGTGKSLICKVLHHTGLRSKSNLVEVNCSAIPDELFEAELFGHSKGAFTDAKSEKLGLFEYAQQGTLFLDEVGNLSPLAQGKLLKILEDKKLRRVGDVAEKDIDVRVVAATNIDLQQAIRDGKFREDLFYRLNLLTIEIPPLRERPKDIPELAEYYIKFYATLYNKSNLELENKAVEEMINYSWPGNIRELSNIMERAVLLSKNKIIKAKDITTAMNKGRITPAERQQIIIDIPPQGISLEKIEQHIIKQILNMFNWNKTETAKYLGISRPRLRRIIETSGVEQNRRKV